MWRSSKYWKTCGESRLIEIILFCSLTLASPYYDCSEDWAIFYDTSSQWIKSPNQGWVVGYADIDKRRIDIGGMKKDVCGNSLLWHELGHLKYKDSSHKWYEGYEDCDPFENVEWN